VHHGGFGATAAAFRGGIPARVIPHIIDQFIWGQRVCELGADLESIPRSELTVSELAAALDQVLYTPAFQERAAHLGAQIRNEAGLESAARLIEEASAQ
jgi:sterol 3beta-glucosyltransferase